VGSTRVPDPRAIRELLDSIRSAFDAANGDFIGQLRQRMRNMAHGLALQAGHRPNDNFARLHAWSFSLEDPVAILSDKISGPDWQVRPVAVAARWQDELRVLIAELHRAQREFSGRPLGNAAASALDGTGPFLLDVRSVDDVGAFGL